MAEITKEDLNKLEENLGGMISKGFNENTEQHQQILAILDKHAVTLIDHTEILKNHTEILKDHTATLKEHTEILKDHTERLQRIETKLENVVYHREFDELKGRVETLENLLEIKKKT